MKTVIFLCLFGVLLYGVGRMIWDGRHLYPRGRMWQRHITGVVGVLSVGLFVIAILAAAFK